MPAPAREARPAASAPAPSAPPPSEAEIALREEIRALIMRLPKQSIVESALAAGPFAAQEKFPKTADALAAHATETEGWLNAFTEAELRDVATELSARIPAKDLKVVKGMLGEEVQRVEKLATAGAGQAVASAAPPAPPPPNATASAPATPPDDGPNAKGAA
jgi:hypothetical protein